MITNCSHQTSALHRLVPIADGFALRCRNVPSLRFLIEESDLAAATSLHSRDLTLRSQSTTALRIAPQTLKSP